MKIAIYGRSGNKNNAAFYEQLVSKLAEYSIEIVVFEPLYKYVKSKNIVIPVLFNTHEDIAAINPDFVLSVGGDGTLLDTVELVRDLGIPVLGINTGRLGFLANVNANDIALAIESLVKGHYSMDKRTLLRVETYSQLFGDAPYALNELTIHKKDSSSMITIHAYLNGEYLNSYWADGLIISTPTGSTGYSLSCGGPIMVPQSESFVITPIAPHNLNVRPIVVSDKNVISIEIEGRSKHYMAALDSRSFTIDAKTQLAVRKEDFTINLVKLNNRNFLDTLRDKLAWGLDSRN